MKTSDLSYSLMSILFTKKYNQMVSESHHAVFCTSMDKISLTAVHWMNIVIIFRFLHWTYVPNNWETLNLVFVSHMTQFAVIRYGSALALAQVYTATLIPIHMTQFALLPQTSTADCNPCTSQRQCSTKREKEKIECTMQDFLRKQIMLRVVIRILQMTTNRSRFSIYIAFKAWQSIVLHSE